MKRLLIGITLLLATTGAIAQGVNVRGSRSCADWIQERTQEVPNRFTAVDSTRNWLTGYLSGLAIGASRNFWGQPNVNLLSNQSVFFWVDNYCRANPLKDIDDAGTALFLERCPTAASCR